MNWLSRKARDLLELDDTPRAIAVGVAIGTFVGFIPLLGFKTILAIGGAKIARGNLIASALAVTLHDLLIPLAPVLLQWEYRIGAAILGNPAPLPPSPPDSPLGFAAWMHWSTLGEVGLPLLLGASIFGLLAGAVAGGVFHRVLLRRATNRSQKQGSCSTSELTPPDLDRRPR